MKKKIRVAFAGVGSNTSATLQMIVRGHMLDKGEENGVNFAKIYDYSISDIEIACCFDVDERKVGKDISEAIFVVDNACRRYVDVPKLNIPVLSGPLFDGIDGKLNNEIPVHINSKSNDIVDVVKKLKEYEVDVLVANLPTGAEKAVKEYAKAAANAKVAFINTTPEKVARDLEIQKLFIDNNVPLLGDDLRSHLGATTLHMNLIELLKSRGLKVTNTYQLNFGGNMDFLNLSSPGRANSKQNSKRNALFAAGIDASKVAAGPNGFVEYLGDTKICYLHIDAVSILDSPLSLEIRLKVEDSPNAAGVIVNAIRVAKVAIDKKMCGNIQEVGAYLFKSPAVGMTEENGFNSFLQFIGGEQA